jgi:hypothetical protein
VQGGIKNMGFPSSAGAVSILHLLDDKLDDDVEISVYMKWGIILFMIICTLFSIRILIEILK